MSEADNFLSRWARRKSEAEKPSPLESGVAPQPNIKADESPDPEDLDLESLPAVDSITETTDISGFLRSGVPPELTRSALRQAWASDPAIRDFIGIAENQWDFTDPTAIPGFGPLLETDDLPRLVAQALGTFDKSSVAFEDATVPAEEALPAMYGSQCGTVDTAVQQTDTSGPAQIDKAGMAVTDESPPVESRRQNRRRPHGSALPQ
jgi:Protein of unknown function (DUF3306)